MRLFDGAGCEGSILNRIFHKEYSIKNKTARQMKMGRDKATRLRTHYRFIGERIRQLRGDMGQEELATYLGISQGQLSKIENGVVPPTVDVLLLLSGKFSKTVDWILKGKAN